MRTATFIYGNGVPDSCDTPAQVGWRAGTDRVFRLVLLALPDACLIKSGMTRTLLISSWLLKTYGMTMNSKSKCVFPV